MKNNPGILLVGTGAVGSYFAGRLHQAGARVAAVCRSDYDAVKEKGIFIKSINGDYHFIPEETVKNASDCSMEPDYIMVATKVLPEINVPGLIKEKVKAGTSIFLLQNGIDIERHAAEAFPENELISGLAFICVRRTSFGNIDHEDYGRIVIGKYPSGNSRKVDILSELFIKSGVSCSIESDIITARWKKLLWNAPFNPISVLAGGKNTRKMCDSEPTLTLVRKVMEEVRNLAVASGHPFPESAIQKNLDDTFVMTPYKTSMLLDYENGRPMEVEAILGNAVRIAKNLGLNVPHVESLYGLLYLKNMK